MSQPNQELLFDSVAVPDAKHAGPPPAPARGARHVGARGWLDQRLARLRRARFFPTNRELLLGLAVASIAGFAGWSIGAKPWSKTHGARVATGHPKNALVAARHSATAKLSAAPAAALAHRAQPGTNPHSAAHDRLKAHPKHVSAAPHAHAPAHRP